MFRLEKKIFVEGPTPPDAIARSCYVYAAGGMPLAFTQEDFLVPIKFTCECKQAPWKLDVIRQSRKCNVLYYYIISFSHVQCKTFYVKCYCICPSNDTYCLMGTQNCVVVVISCFCKLNGLCCKLNIRFGFLNYVTQPCMYLSVLFKWDSCEYYKRNNSKIQWWDVCDFHYTQNGTKIRGFPIRTDSYCRVVTSVLMWRVLTILWKRRIVVSEEVRELCWLALAGVCS